MLNLSLSISPCPRLSLITLSRGRQLPYSEDTQEDYGETHMMKNQGLSATSWVSLEPDMLRPAMQGSLESDPPPLKPWDECSSGQNFGSNFMTDTKSELSS